MARTEAQRLADNQLTTAVEAVLEAYRGENDDKPWMLMEYVVITSQHWTDDEGDSYTGVGHIFRDSDVPYHRALGLMEYARIRLGKEIQEDDD